MNTPSTRATPSSTFLRPQGRAPSAATGRRIFYPSPAAAVQPSPGALLRTPFPSPFPPPSSTPRSIGRGGGETNSNLHTPQSAITNRSRHNNENVIAGNFALPTFLYCCVTMANNLESTSLVLLFVYNFSIPFHAVKALFSIDLGACVCVGFSGKQLSAHIHEQTSLLLNLALKTSDRLRSCTSLNPSFPRPLFMLLVIILSFQLWRTVEASLEVKSAWLSST